MTTDPPRRTLTAATCMLYGVSAMAASLTGASLPRIASDLHIDDGQSGLLASLLMVGITAGVLHGGFWADARGRRTVTLSGLLLMHLSLWAFAASRSYLLAAASLVVMGLAVGWVQVVSNAIIADLYPHRAGAVMTSAQSLYTAGMSIGPQLVALAAAQAWHWTAPYRLTALALLLPLALAWKSQFPSSPAQPPPSRERLPWSDARLWRLASAMVCYLIAESVIIAWTVTHLTRTTGVTVASASRTLSLFWLVVMVVRLGTGWLIRPQRVATALCFSSMLAAATWGAVAVSHSPQGIAALVPAAGIGTGLMFPLLLTTTHLVFGRRFATASGLVMAIGCVVSTPAPAVIGWLSDTVGLGFGFAVAALSLMAVAALAPKPVMNGPEERAEHEIPV